MNVNITIQKNRSASNDINVNISELIESAESDSINGSEIYDSDYSEESFDSDESIETIVMDIDETTLQTREQIIYTENQIDDIIDDQEIINRELKKLRRKGTSIIYPNQDATANKIMETFINREVVNIMVIAKTQSGKTGTMCATIQKFMNTTDESLMIPRDNIYIITGLSSCEWKKQTKERLPGSIQNNVYHRGDLLKTFINEVKQKKNVLIIMDEIQIASNYQQTIYKTFLDGKFLNGNTLYENDIKILEFTATPDGTLYDLNLWGNGARKILAQPPSTYISSYDIYQKGNMKQYRNLSAKEDYEIYYEELKNDIESFDTPMYHIIRKPIKNEEIFTNRFRSYFKEGNYFYDYYDGESKEREDLDDLNEILIKPPTNHTFIFIKEMLRCAKTLYKKYIGVVYERYSNDPGDSIIVQGLAGRLTGYDYNGKSICYTNINTIIRYEQLWNSDFEDKSIKWKVSSKKPTFNHPDIYDNTKISNVLNPDLEFMRIPIIIPLEDNEEDNIIYTYEGKTKNVQNAKKLFLQEKLLYLACYDESSDYYKLFNFIKKFKCKQFTKPRSTNNHKKHVLDSIKAANENRKFAIAFNNKDKEKSTWEAFVSEPIKDELQGRPRCICIIVWSKNPEIY